MAALCANEAVLRGIATLGKRAPRRPGPRIFAERAVWRHSRAAAPPSRRGATSGGEFSAREGDLPAAEGSKIIIEGETFVLLKDDDDGGGQEGGLSWVDKLLALWILMACATGTALSHFPAARQGISAASVGGTNILIAVGLILMMYPPLAKVHYDWIPKLLLQVRPMALSLVQNWIIGPLLMFFLAYAFLKDHPEYLQGVILVGCARCIAMVIVWNEFAGGDSELCATLVAMNSILTLVLYAFYAYALINKLLPALGVTTTQISLGFSSVLESVAIYLGIPFALGLLTWIVLRKIKGDEWYYGKFVKWISPITLIALLFTIVMLFALEGYAIVQKPMELLLCAAPMLIYFFVMFLGSFFMAYFLGCEYSHCATIAFTAASNNFELALAVAVAIFGLGSPGAFSTVVGPLVEIPVMLLLVNLAKTFSRVCFENGQRKSGTGELERGKS